MNRRAARRLARRATRHDQPGLRARWALRRLDRAIGRGNWYAVNAAWQAWLDRPAPPLWEILVRRGREANSEIENGPLWLSRLALRRMPLPRHREFGPTVTAAFALGDHPIARIARELILEEAGPALTEAVCEAALADPEGGLARLCAEQLLVPADPVRRAVFLLLIGQIDQYRAADPDGNLLTVGYAAASAEDQRRLRTAMLSTGELDLVRVVAGNGRARVAAMGQDEVGYLGGRLAARAEWPELWRLVRDVSPAQAVDLVRSFPAGWRPPDTTGRRLFDVLAAAPAGAMTLYAQQRYLPEPRYPTDVSFSPDGTQVAILGWVRLGARERNLRRVAVHALPDGALLWGHSWRGEYQMNDGIIHTGDDAVILTGYPPRQFTATGPGIGEPRPDLSDFAGAFAHSGGSPGSRERMIIHPISDRAMRITSLRGLDIHNQSVAVDPGSGRFATYGPAHDSAAQIVLYDGDAQVLARVTVRAALAEVMPYAMLDQLVFAGPDLLVAAGFSGGLVLWRRDGDTLVVEATATTNGKVYYLQAFPAVARITVQDAGAWRAYSTTGLVPVRPPAAGPPWPREVWSAPDGAWAAVHGGSSVGGTLLYRLELPPWLGVLVDRPLATMHPDDLATFSAIEPAVSATAADPATSATVAGPATHATVADSATSAVVADSATAATGSAAAAVVQACLEYRFGGEIAIGLSGRLATEDTDIALS